MVCFSSPAPCPASIFSSGTQQNVADKLCTFHCEVLNPYRIDIFFMLGVRDVIENPIDIK